MKKALILLLAAGLFVSLSACHTAEPAPESSQPVLSSSEPVSSLPEASVPASAPSSVAETSAPSSEADSSRAEAPVSSQAPPPASSNVPKPASSQTLKPPTSSTPPPASSAPPAVSTEAPPASSDPEPTQELPEELKPYRRPLDVDRIIADMVQAGEELGMTYDESLTKEHSAWKPYDETNIFPDGDEPNFKKQAADNVIYVYDYIMAVEPDTLPEQIHFRPYLEPIGNGEYNIYVFYG